MATMVKNANEMMTKEERQLLLVDLCARLSYGVICCVTHKKNGSLVKEDMKLSGTFENGNFYFLDEMGSTYSDDYIPYLRSMSSMTKEEKQEFYDICTTLAADKNHFIMEGCIDSNYMLEKFNWLNEHHFNYRLPNSLFIEAPKEMYKIEY